MTATLPPISEAELVVLRALWETGPTRVRGLLEALPEERWAFTTAQTLLHRLQDKGYVGRDKSAGVTVYRAVVDRDELLRQRVLDLAASFTDGSVVGVLHGLVQGAALSKDEVARMRALLDDVEFAASGRRAASRGRRKRGQER